LNLENFELIDHQQNYGQQLTGYKNSLLIGILEFQRR